MGLSCYCVDDVRFVGTVRNVERHYKQITTVWEYSKQQRSKRTRHPVSPARVEQCEKHRPLRQRKTEITKEKERERGGVKEETEGGN